MDKPAQWALVGAAWFLAISVAVLGFLAWRHLAGGIEVAPALQGSEAALAIGATAICPVTGQKVVVGPNTPHVVYQNRVYYFSDQADAAGLLPRRRFLMDPEAILHPGAAPTLAQQAQTAVAAATAVPLATPVPTRVPAKP